MFYNQLCIHDVSDDTDERGNDSEHGMLKWKTLSIVFTGHSVGHQADNYRLELQPETFAFKRGVFMHPQHGHGQHSVWQRVERLGDIGDDRSNFLIAEDMLPCRH